MPLSDIKLAPISSSAFERLAAAKTIRLGSDFEEQATDAFNRIIDVIINARIFDLINDMLKITFSDQS